MYNNTLKMINNKYSLPVFFSKIVDAAELDTKEREKIGSLLLKKSRGVELVPYSYTILSMLIDQKVGSVIYQIFKNNNISFSRLLKRYSKKINKGVKPDRRVKESGKKLKDIIEVLKINKIIFLNSSGLSLEDNFRKKLISTLEI